MKSVTILLKQILDITADCWGICLANFFNIELLTAGELSLILSRAKKDEGDFSTSFAREKNYGIFSLIIF
jgi:hypothetical protein